MSFTVRPVLYEKDGIEGILCQFCPAAKKKIVTQEMPGCGHRFCHTCITSQVKDGELSCLHKDSHKNSDCQQTAKKVDLLSIRLNIQGGCLICCEENQHLTALPCGHALHLRCIYALDPKLVSGQSKISCPECRKTTTYDAIADPRNERVLALLDSFEELGKPQPNLELIQEYLSGELLPVYTQIVDLLLEHDYEGAQDVLEDLRDEEIDAIVEEIYVKEGGDRSEVAKHKEEIEQVGEKILRHLTEQREPSGVQIGVFDSDDDDDMPPALDSDDDEDVAAPVDPAAPAAPGGVAPATSAVSELIKYIFTVLFEGEMGFLLVMAIQLPFVPEVLGAIGIGLGVFLLTHLALLVTVFVFQEEIPSTDRLLSSVFRIQLALIALMAVFAVGIPMTSYAFAVGIPMTSYAVVAFTSETIALEVFYECLQMSVAMLYVVALAGFIRALMEVVFECFGYHIN